MCDRFVMRSLLITSFQSHGVNENTRGRLNRSLLYCKERWRIKSWHKNCCFESFKIKLYWILKTRQIASPKGLIIRVRWLLLQMLWVSFETSNRTTEYSRVTTCSQALSCNVVRNTGADLGKFLTDASTGNSINNWR